MDASPILTRVAKALSKAKLEVVMVGNAAAALHGSPVTTLDIDFMFQENPRNLTKLKSLAKDLGGMILRPYYPVSRLYRLVCDAPSIQLDFMPRLNGISSFISLRSRAVPVTFGSFNILVADLNDIIKSKRSTGRPQDLAVLSLLERTLEEKEKK